MLSLLQKLNIDVKYKEMELNCFRCKGIRCKINCVAFPDSWVKELIEAETVNLLI